VRDYYRALGFDFAREPFEVVGTQFIVGYEQRQGECELRSGSRDVLSEIGRRGLHQSVLSASQQTRLRAQAEALGVRAAFEQLVGLEDHYAGGKLEQGRRWMEESGARADEVLLVGDTDHDAEVARAMGVRCLLLPGGHQSPERLARCGPPVLASIERLLD
jgi:phosphoglycolate phosphatase